MLRTTKMHPVRQDLFGLFHIFVICLCRISTHFDVNSASGSSNNDEHRRKKHTQTNTHTFKHLFFGTCQRDDLKPMMKNRHDRKKNSGFECIKRKYKHIFALKWVGFFFRSLPNKCLFICQFFHHFYMHRLIIHEHFFSSFFFLVRSFITKFCARGFRHVFYLYVHFCVRLCQQYFFYHCPVWKSLKKNECLELLSFERENNLNKSGKKKYQFWIFCQKNCSHLLSVEWKKATMIISKCATRKNHRICNRNLILCWLPNNLLIFPCACSMQWHRLNTIERGK